MSSNLARVNNIGELLTKCEKSFNAATKGVLDYRQEASFARGLLDANEFLMSAAMENQDAFMRAIINLASIGISLNPALELAYLIPRKGKITYDVSYKGKIALGVQSGSIRFCIPELVYKDDKFKPGKAGDRPIHEYDPFLKTQERGELRGGYAVAKTHSKEYIVSYMSMQSIYAIRARSEAYKSKKGPSGPWVTDADEMIKKTLIRRNSKLWPLSSTHDRNRLDLATALEDEQDPLPEIKDVKPEEQAIKIAILKNALDELNIDHEYYVKEKLSKITRRKIDKFEDLTDIELDNRVVEIVQMLKESNDENAKTN